MARGPDQIIADLSAFSPVGGDWRPLDALLAELWATGEAERHVGDMLVVLERFPEEDGAGVLWSIVHGLESLPGYERELVGSVQRRPSELGVTMIGRLLNAGVSQVGAISLVDLLESVAAGTTAPASVRLCAAEWLQEHSGG